MGSCSDGRVAGSLVWVRRPNGSWWPGLVLSPEEMPERRKGTPVKLLGREDGSTDWYDLEKSKRIKAFRCGEYDVCIEKAKAASVHTNKMDRTGKYAKRGDAILHALELEKAYCANETNKFPSKAQNHMAKRSTKPEKEFAQSVIAVENNVNDTNLKVKKYRWRTQSNSDDDTKSGKRMKGLQDLSGMRSKRQHGDVKDTKLHKLANLNNTSVGETNISNDSLHKKYGSNSSSKRKPQKFQLNETSKRKDRRRPLTKVLESTARMSIPSPSNQLTSTCKSSMLEITQNKSSTLDSSESRKTDLSVVLNDSSEFSGCPDKSHKEASDAHEDTSCIAISETLNSDIKDFGPLAPEDANETSSYVLFDVPIFTEENQNKDVFQLITSNSRDDVAEKPPSRCSNAKESSDMKDIHVSPDSPAKQTTTAGPFTYHSKRKRNSKCQRKLTDCYMMDQTHGDWSSTGSDRRLYESFTSRSNRQPVQCGMFSSEVENVNANQIEGTSDLPYSWEQQEHCSKQDTDRLNDLHTNFQNAISREKEVETNSDSIISDFSFPSEDTSQQQARHSMDFQNSQLEDEAFADPFLYEVIVDIQSSYKASHVSLVSFTSKLNGKAIIGHPISVEAIESCSLSPFENATGSCSLICKTDVSRAKKRVDIQLPQNRQHCRTHKVRQRTKRTSGRNLKVRKGSRTTRRKSVSSKKKSSKTTKSQLLSKKIRKLSSITGFGKVDKPAVDKLKGSIVSCVPLSLVFGRINEALGCSSCPKVDDV